jgi:class 3 adenylate cyclase/tetratricopeptide (TPR) repeat protein
LDIAAWLREQGLERYTQAFEANDVDAAVLRTLTADDLKELGVASLGHRKKLLEAIAALAGPPSTAPLGEALATAPETPPARQEAERRQLTVLFCDLVGSTALAARLDPEDMGLVIRAYQGRCAEVIKRWGGHVAKYMGDGVLAYFGWPQAHEDDAERAVRAGLELIKAVSALEAPGSALGGGRDERQLAARVGIATGLVVVGDLVGEGAAQEQAVVGETPNLAARLQALAAPGQVAIADATRRLLGAGFELEDRNERELKGISGPVRAYVVTGERPVESRFEARSGPALLPMVGRDQELVLLLERWALAKAGEGQGVLLVGEAGIGKSRISRALLDAVTDEPHFRVRYQCSPYHTDSALWPVIQHLNFAAGVDADDPVEARLDKLEALLDRAGGHGAAPLIADLLGLDVSARYGRLDLTPQAQRIRTLDALVDQLLGLAARQPVLVVVEDAHWIDPTTLEMIELGLDRIAGARVLLLLTSRPDRQPALAAHPHVTRLTLNRLGRAGVEAIVARLGGDRLPGATIDAIIARTDGVPLFVEELTKAVLETGEASIPASLHDSLMARLDRIPEVKEVAQIAASIGREFDYPLLAAVVDRTEPDLRSALDQLTGSELIFRRGRPPDARYIFKHALVQDAAYQSLLKGRRQQLHARIAEILEQRFPDTVEAEPELLASHYTAAGLTEVGVRYWERAGARATERSAFVEAINHYGKGLELLSTLSDGQARNRLELSLQMGLGDAFSWTRGFAAAEVEAAYNRAHELSRQMGETPELFRILWGLWHFFVIRGDFGRSRELGQELSQLGQRLQDPTLVPHIYRTLGETALWRGEFAAAQREASTCLAGPELPPPKLIPGVQDPLVMCGAWLALALWHLGYPDQALARMDAALERAKGSGHSGDLGAALIFAAWIRVLRRDTKSAREFAETALRFNAERGHPFHVAISDVLLGSVLVTEEHDAVGLSHMRDGIAQSSATGAGIFQPWCLALLAAGQAQLGDPEAGLITLAEAESRVRQSGERWPEAEIHRLKGELTLSMAGADAEAERCFRMSIEVARGQQARSAELRAATSVARLWAEQGKRAQARDLLAPVYGWFTEGFDTADLEDAKALLDELS